MKIEKEVKNWEFKELEEAPRNKENNHFVSFRPLGYNESFNWISTCITYPCIKFGDDSSTMAEKDFWEVKQSSPKKDFVVKIEIFHGQFTPQRWSFK